MIYRALFGQWFAIAYVAAISFGLTIILARTLGPDKFGLYSYVLSFASIYAIIQDGGFRTLIFREGVSGHEAESVNSLLQFAFGHVVLTTLAGIFFVILFDLDEKKLFLIAILCFSLLTISSFVSAYLKALGRFDKESLWQVLGRSLTVILMIASLVYLPLEVEYIFTAWLTGILIALLSPWFRFIWTRPLFNVNISAYRSCFAFLVIDAATVFYFRSDILLLEYLGVPLSDVGQYAVAYKFLEGVILIATPVAHIAFRTLRVRWNNNEYSSLLLIKLIFVMLSASFIMILLSQLFGQSFVTFSFGEEYQLAGKLLFWLMIALMFILPNYILSQAAIAFNLEKKYAYSVLLAAVLNVILNILMIPQYGTFGAAISTFITEGVLCLSLVFILKNSIKVKNENRC